MYGLLNLIILLQHLQDKERDVRNVRAGAGELRMNLLRRSQICHLQLKDYYVMMREWRKKVHIQIMEQVLEGYVIKCLLHCISSCRCPEVKHLIAIKQRTVKNIMKGI